MATDLASAIASLDEFELDLAEAHANFLATTGIILSFMGPFAVVSFLIQAIFGGVILGAIGGAIGIGALLTSDELRKRIQEVKNQCDASYYGSSGVCQACGCDATGSSGTTCDSAGQCTCNTGYSGTTCSQCATSYYSSGGICQGK